MLDKQLAVALTDALASADMDTVADLTADVNIPDLADFIADIVLPGEETEVLMSQPIERRAEIFGYLPLPLQEAIAPMLTASQLSELVTHMPTDERADLFNVLDEGLKQQLFQRLAKEEREDIRRLASYEEGSAGAIMSSDYVWASLGMTVGEALAVIRRTAPDKETIYQVYVLDSAHQLVGVVSLRELIVAAGNVLVDSLMTTEIVSAVVNEEQREVARLIARYDLLALPIVDAAHKLVGIVTYDDAMDVQEAETTEDIHRGANISKLEVNFSDATPVELYRSRVHWLVILVFANIFTGAGIAYFEDTIAAHIALLFFMPLLVASAGNAGSQSATLMVRGMATGDVTGRDWGRLISKEIFVATALGLTMALAVMAVGYFRAGPNIALVVSITMIVVVMVGSLIGMVLPLLLKRLNFDPATASTPLITTIADVSGVLIYFGIATAVLGLN